MSQKTEKDEVCWEILGKNDRNADLIVKGQKLITDIQKMNKIPVNLFYKSIEEAKLTFNDHLIKALENETYKINLPNLLDQLNIDTLINDLIETTEEAKKEFLLSISEMCQEKKPLINNTEIPKNSDPISLEYLSKSPIRVLKKEQVTSGYLIMNQNDLSSDSVKTVKRNLSNCDVKLEGFNIKVKKSSNNENSNQAITSFSNKIKSIKTNEELTRPFSLSHSKKSENLTNLEEIGVGTPLKKIPKKPSIFEKNIMNKQNLLVKLKIPEKYKIIFEDLKNDRIEQVDLSNAGFLIFCLIFNKK